MRKLKFKLNRNVLTTIYLTFIRPTLEYADIVWQNIQLYLQDELEQIQLEAARIITGAIKLTSREPLYKETGLVKPSERRRHHRLILFHKMVNKRAPQYLNSLVPPKVSHTYYTRNNLNLQETAALLIIKTRFFRKQSTIGICCLLKQNPLNPSPPSKTK